MCQRATDALLASFFYAARERLVKAERNPSTPTLTLTQVLYTYKHIQTDEHAALYWGYATISAHMYAVRIYGNS